MAENTPDRHAQLRDQSTSGGDGYASVDDATVKRDEDGNLLPVEKEVSFSPYPAKVKPMPYGAVERTFGEAGNVADIDSDQIADVLDGGEWEPRVIRPDLRSMGEEMGYTQEVVNPKTEETETVGRISGEIVRKHLKPLVPRDLITAILESSGVEADVDMQEGGGARVEVEDTGNRR